jgi:2-keto-4-pentenoate hydratase
MLACQFSGELHRDWRRQLEPEVTVDTTIDREIDTAHELDRALRDRAPRSPVRSVLTDLASAYSVQERVIALRESVNNPRIGRKVGLTSPSVQAQLGVDQPDFGVLLQDMLLTEDATVPTADLIAPRIEAEIAFVLDRDVDSTDRGSVLGAVAFAVPALEIVDSRIADWDISIIDTVADNASSAYFVLGEARIPLGEIDTIAAEMTLSRNGQPASTGSGAACLGDPLNALVWVAETAARLGRPLRAGEIVMSGALGPMVPLHPGDVFTATVSGLGTVTITADDPSASPAGKASS